MGPFDEKDDAEPSILSGKAKILPQSTDRKGIRAWLSPVFGSDEYFQVEDGDEQGTAALLRKQLQKKTRSVWAWRCISAALTAVLVITWLATPPHPPPRYPQPEEGHDNMLKWMAKAEVAEGHFWCGSSAAEARALGCSFNRLHNKWMPSQCAADFEHARTAVLEALGDPAPSFQFYLDEDGKPGAAIPDGDLDGLELLTPAWTTRGHHMTHCMYMLLQGAAALNLGARADMVVHTWEHAKHCATVILNETKRVPDWDEVASFGHTQAGACW
ncbi:hypothetical protein CPLU01_13046 [Colletotrichum plurivorum]|uniref:Uncharacterized protein n=1 Tax=Colletotrichum plurivorum TaxID=2175906 RepID=A0A8H6JV65_9PEZI|nr:hypothetical protein CPLU01_13046 [Colletotrichum plurivorum]